MAVLLASWLASLLAWRLVALAFFVVPPLVLVLAWLRVALSALAGQWESLPDGVRAGFASRR
jgi:hypothetical protein